MKEPCCIVYDWDCEAPANIEYINLPKIKTKCFACGQIVCKRCSKIVKYYKYGKKRLCFSCLAEYDLENAIKGK